MERDRGIEAHVGEASELPPDLGRQAELELAHPEPDELVAAEPAQRGAQIVPRADGGEVGLELRGEHLARLLVAKVVVRRHAEEAGRIPADQRGEVRRRLAGERGDAAHGGIEAVRVEPGLDRRVQHPLGAPERIGLVRRTPGQIRGMQAGEGSDHAVRLA